MGSKYSSTACLCKQALLVDGTSLQASTGHNANLTNEHQRSDHCQQGDPHLPQSSGSRRHPPDHCYGYNWEWAAAAAAAVATAAKAGLGSMKGRFSSPRAGAGPLAELMNETNEVPFANGWVLRLTVVTGWGRYKLGEACCLWGSGWVGCMRAKGKQGDGLKAAIPPRKGAADD